MPLIHVSLFEGRTLKCTAESVDVIFEDVKKSDWASGGKLASDPK